MDVAALIMAGGKGARMGLYEEKPMIPVGGVPMIGRVINCLRGVEKIGMIVVAVSPHTPKTSAKAKELQVEVVETAGLGYVQDAKQAIKKLKPRTILEVCADLPILRSRTIDEILRRFEVCGKPSLEVMVRFSTCVSLGLEPELCLDVRGETLCPAGVNVMSSERIDEPEIDREILILDKPELAVNVNSCKDLVVAERLLNISDGGCKRFLGCSGKASS